MILIIVGSFVFSAGVNTFIISANLGEGRDGYFANLTYAFDIASLVYVYFKCGINCIRL